MLHTICAHDGVHNLPSPAKRSYFWVIDIKVTKFNLSFYPKLHKFLMLGLEKMFFVFFEMSAFDVELMTAPLTFIYN